MAGSAGQDQGASIPKEKSHSSDYEGCMEEGPCKGVVEKEEERSICIWRAIWLVNVTL